MWRVVQIFLCAGARKTMMEEPGVREKGPFIYTRIGLKGTRVLWELFCIYSTILPAFWCWRPIPGRNSTSGSDSTDNYINT